MAKNYLAEVKKLASTPSQKPGWRRTLVYARNKRGKSYLALSYGRERTLVIDPEDGTDTMRKLNPYRVKVRSWQEMTTVAGALRTGRLSPKSLGLGTSTTPFDVLSVDGLTRINNMALHFVRQRREADNLEKKPGMIDRRDYGKSGELMKQLLIQLQALPMHIIYTAQERTKTLNFDDAEDSDEGVFIVPDIPDAVRGAANSWVEVIARLYLTRATVKIGKGKNAPTEEVVQRRLWIGYHDQYDTGYRSDFAPLPDYIIDPTLPKLEKLMLTGKEG